MRCGNLQLCYLQPQIEWGVRGMPVSAIWMALIFFASVGALSAAELPQSIVAPALEQADCVPAASELQKPESYDVEGGLKLVVVPCGIGAYNQISILFVSDPARPEASRQLHFIGLDPDTKRWKNADTLSNVEYDSAKHSIRTRFHYRGIGDCGASGEYTWSGQEFNLTAFWLKTKCDRVPFEPGGSKWRVALPR
jgi:hypothetical protein